MDILLYAVDWHRHYRPACLALLALRSPYSVPGFVNPPWVLFPLLPFALMPEWLGRILLFIASLILFAFIARRMGAGRLALVAFLLAPPTILSLWHGNVEALVLLGAVLPPQLGLFFILIKPQMGAILALIWLVQSYRAGGWRTCATTFAPVTCAFVLSFVLFGLWPLNASDMSSATWNDSLWPVSLAIGLPLMVYALRRDNERAALAAGPMFSPYVASNSYTACLAALMAHPLEMVAASVGLWAAIIANIG